MRLRASGRFLGTALHLSFIRQFLLNYFQIEERSSTISTEVFAGITTYLSLSFVFILNPAILSASPPDSHGVAMAPASILLATVITSSLATIGMGIFAKLPLAVGPGIEVSAFFTYVLVQRMHLSWEEALFAVVLSGLLNFILTLFSIRERIVEAIPEGLKASLLLTIGVFVLLVGFKLGNVIDVGSFTRLMVTEHGFWAKSNLLQGPFILLVGLCTAALFNLRRLRLPWGTLIGIIAAAIACHLVGVQSTAPHDTGQWHQTFWKASPAAVWTPTFWNGVIIMFVIDFVGGISKIYALTDGTHIPRKGDKVPGLQPALFVDGVATFFGGWFGTSSLIAFVESRIGIEAGGQTGLSAVVCGLLMLAGGIFSELLVLIPPQAAAGVLVYVGCLLIALNCRSLRRLPLNSMDGIVVIAMAALVAISFQFHYAMVLGFSAYFVRAWRQGVPVQSIFWLGLVAASLLGTLPLWML